MATVTGVEITQSTQTFRSINALCGTATTAVVCPDNALPVVEGKDTYIRVYFEGPSPAPSGNLSGLLLTYPIAPSVTGTYIAAVASRPANAIGTRPDRLRTDNNFLFKIPASMAQGSGIYRVYTTSSSRRTDFFDFVISYAKPLPIKVNLLRIALASPGQNAAAPSVQDFWATARLLAKLIPVTTPGITLTDSVVTVSVPVAVNPTVAGSVWDVMRQARIARALGPDVIQVALYAGNAVNQGPYTAGVGLSWGADVGCMSGQPIQFAHLMMRVLWEVTSPVIAPIPASMSVYNPPPMFFVDVGTGSVPIRAPLGEAGFNADTLQPVEPIWRDIMSVSPLERWISSFDYLGLVPRLIPPPVTPPPVTPQTLDDASNRIPWPQETRLDIGVIQRILERHQLVPIPHFGPPGPPPVRPNDGEYRIELLDAKDNVVDQTFFDFPRPRSEADSPKRGKGQPEYASVPILWFNGAAKLRVFRGKKMVAEEKASGRAPRLDVRFAPGEAPLGGTRKLSWTASRGDGDISAFARYTADGGNTWTMVGRGGAKESIDINFDSLAGGSECYLEVYASSGWHPRSYRSPRFQVENKGFAPYLISPAEETTIKAGEPLTLVGAPSSAGRDAGALMWSSDRDGLLGEGASLEIANLSVGTHAISLRMRSYPDSPATVIVNVGTPARGKAKRR